eukprot:356245-Chlamydomonas_euryale.AAC.3
MQWPGAARELLALPVCRRSVRLKERLKRHLQARVQAQARALSDGRPRDECGADPQPGACVDERRRTATQGRDGASLLPTDLVRWCLEAECDAAAVPCFSRVQRRGQLSTCRRHCRSRSLPRFPPPLSQTPPRFSARRAAAQLCASARNKRGAGLAAAAAAAAATGGAGGAARCAERGPCSSAPARLQQRAATRKARAQSGER